MIKTIDKTRYFRAVDLGRTDNLYIFYTDGTLIDENIKPNTPVNEVRLYLQGVKLKPVVNQEVKKVVKTEKKVSKKR